MKKEQTYEQALREIEDVVKRLEGGNLPLEESLQLYERGVFLTRYCTELLDTAEKRIRILSKNQEGEPQEEEFESLPE
jgi:exodeoxyribonuclease VII small subunit